MGGRPQYAICLMKLISLVKRLRRARPGFIGTATAAGYAAILILFSVFGAYMGDFIQAKNRAQIADDTYRILQAVLAPAVWEDCVPVTPSTPPDSCDSADQELSGNISYDIIELRDYYALSPPPGVPHTCDPFGRAAFSTRSATVEGVSPDLPGYPILRQAIERRQLLPHTSAWTAIPVDPTTTPGTFAAPLQVQVEDPANINPVTGSIDAYTSPVLWKFATDVAGPDGCYVIVAERLPVVLSPDVTAGRRISYVDPSTNTAVDCILTSRGANTPCA